MSTITSLINLHGRRAMITGAAGNLGRSIAKTLAELGADLCLVDRPGTDFTDLVESLENQWHVKVETGHCDLELQNERQRLVEDEIRAERSINILVNNAAFVGTSELEGWAVPFEQQTIDAWRRAVEVNLTASFHLCQGLYPLLKVAEGANILNISSIYGQYGPDWGLYEGTKMANPAAYAASKGGLIQLTRWLATTLAPEVRVNAISPGGIFRNQPEQFVTRYNARTPLRRMATETDFCGTVAYLVSDMSGYVTGQNIAVDGGWGVW